VVFVNKKLGNGFVINAIDSTKDQEHYFGGHKKYVPLVVRFLSGTTSVGDEPISAITTGDIGGDTALLFAASGSFISFEYSVETTGSNNVECAGAVLTGSSAEQFFGFSVPRERLCLEVSVEFSCSDYAIGQPYGIERELFFNLKDFNGYDSDSGRWRGYKESGPNGKYYPKYESIGDGWYRSTYTFPVQEYPTFSLDVSDFTLFVQEGINQVAQTRTLWFRNMKCSFLQDLEGSGVEKFKILDNQFAENESLYINRNIMPKVEASPLREISYYGWQDFVILESFAFNIFDAYIRGIAIDESRNILYACGNTVQGGQNSWFVVRSINKGISWTTVDGMALSGAAWDIAVDSGGGVYVCGEEVITGTNKNWIVRKSTDGSSGSFETVDSFNRNNTYDAAFGIAVDSGGNVYVCGREQDADSINWIVRKSTDGSSGSFVFVDYVSNSLSNEANDICVDSNDNVYVCGYETGPSLSNDWIVRKSTNGSSGSFGYVDHVHRDNGADVAWGICVNSSDNVYVCGYETVTDESTNWIVRKSTDGSSGSFGYIDSYDAENGIDLASKLHTDSSDNVYVCGYITTSGGTTQGVVRKSTDGSSGSFEVVDYFSGSASHIFIDSKDYIYVCGQRAKKGILRVGKLRANSASLGPRMLATSFGYVFSEFSGTTNERFKLNNISEFPHSSGIFQMKNVALGTIDSGKVGKTDDSIIQVSYFGSVVHIVWPQQDRGDSFVKGYGSFSSGQRPGKLVSSWSTGSFFDVTEYDHLSLYAYLVKQISGTLDNVDIRIERRPLHDSPFAIDQAVEYSTTGSDAYATYRDLIHTKEIDYGDLSIKEIGWPIDIPLTNVKEIRISARHRNGQTEDVNKNFIVWGRLIKSEEET